MIDQPGLGAQIRADIVERGEFFVPCDDFPAADGMYWIDLCITGVPASKCGETVYSTGTGMFELEHQGAPVISMLQTANDGNVLVSFSPDVTDARCERR